MKQWLLLNSFVMAGANSGANTAKIIRASPGQNVKAGVSSIYSIKLTSSYFPISFIVNFQICWCAQHNMTHISQLLLLSLTRSARKESQASLVPPAGGDGEIGLHQKRRWWKEIDCSWVYWYCDRGTNFGIFIFKFWSLQLVANRQLIFEYSNNARHKVLSL